MSSLPCGWNDLLVKLGFTRKKRKELSRFGQFAKRLHMESLESRTLLSITVTTLVDERDGNIETDGDVSLRDAIELAPAGETIDFAQGLNAGIINLIGGGAFGQIAFGKNLTIDASMLPQGLTINAGHQNFRIFDITDPISGPDSPHVVLKGLRLTGGNVSSDGGAIRSAARLSVIDCILEDNEARHGGAIYLQVADTSAVPRDVLTIQNSRGSKGDRSIY